MKTEKTNYDSIDLLKFILSILIIQIHSDFYLEWMKPYVRIAVPTFFIISSFFFFKKSPTVNNLWKYVERLSKLYLFWFIAWGSYFFYANRDVFISDFCDGIAFLLKSIFMGSTFAASWYISASIIGTIIVFYLSKKIPNWLLLLLVSIIYAIVTLSTSYYNLFRDSFGIVDDYFYEYTNTHLSVSFPVSLIFITIGKILAEFKLIQHSKAIIVLLLFVSLVSLQLEFTLVKRLYRLDDCFFFIIPSSIFLFLLFYNLHHSLTYAKILRNISTIVYCSHYSIILITGICVFRFTNGSLSPLEKFLIGSIGGGYLVRNYNIVRKQKTFFMA